MAAKDQQDFTRQIDKIYDDTLFFVDAITSEYGFYGQFMDSLGNTETDVNVQRQRIRKTIETAWVDVIEAALPVIDTSIRHPSAGLIEKEEILPVEFSNHVTVKSLIHLSQHTDFISRIEDGMVIPSKLLNCYYDENKQTYENKFLNTLIDHLIRFVDRRYDELKDRRTEETQLKFDFESPFSVYGAKGRIKFSVEASTPDGAENDATVERIARIHRILTQYAGSEFVKSMEGAMIQPPVMRTNAIKKNKYLSQCLDLWDFIETYDKVGYTVEVDGSAEKADDEYMDQLYSLLSIQYFMFEYNLNKRFREGNMPLASHHSNPVKPDFIKRLEVLDEKKFNIFDTEYKKIVNVFGGPSQKRLTKEETAIRDAVNLALSQDKKLFMKEKHEKKKNSGGDGK